MNISVMSKYNHFFNIDFREKRFLIAPYLHKKLYN